MASNTEIHRTIDEQFQAQLSSAIDKGIDYLHDHQYPNGEFCFYVSPDEEMLEWCYPDSTVFCTTIIASCILKLKAEPIANHILQKAGYFLQYQMMRGGLWNFFTKFHVNFKFSPADADTTAYTSTVLKELGFDVPNNKDLLLKNRNKNGLFYTWLVLRKNSVFDLSTLRVVGRELKRPFLSIAFWLKHEAKRNDIDVVVNANALYYLGLNENTNGALTYLIKTIKSANEEESDKWYKNPIVVYYFVSRNYQKIKELEPVKRPIIERLLAKVNEHGGFGKSDMENALAINTLLNFLYQGKEIKTAITVLLNAQNKSGYWKRALFFYAGHSRVVGWGSEETTTAFCLEALAMYRDQHNLNGQN